MWKFAKLYAKYKNNQILKGNSRTNNLTDSEFLFWLHRRLVNCYLEDTETDYIKRLENIARNLECDEYLVYED